MLAKSLSPKACNFYWKENTAQVFSCEFCDIFQSSFFKEYFYWAKASVANIIQILAITQQGSWQHCLHYILTKHLPV